MRENREPPRLADENVTALEQALLAAGRAYGSSASARNKTLAALGVAGSATLLAGTAQAVPLGALAKLTWSKILVAVSLAGAAAAVPSYYAWQRHEAAARVTAQRVAVASPTRTDETPPWMRSRSSGEQVSVGGPRSVGRLDVDHPSTATPGDDAGSHSGRVRSGATLAQELSALDGARGMLARGDATGALARLDRYARAHPHGRLALEAEVLRIDALDAAGRPDAARARAQAFLDRYPHSVLAARVRTRLGD